MSCNGAYLGSATAAGPDGTFTGSGDTTGRADGANTLTAVAYWTDPFGARHSWPAPAVPVTVNNAPRVTIDQCIRTGISARMGTGRKTPPTIYYCLSKDAKVDATVTDASGATVRSIESAAAKTGGTYCPGGSNNYRSWDGKDTAGAWSPTASTR